MILNNITDVFFDLDHTLWDFEKNSALALENVLAKHQVNVSLDDFLAHYSPLNFAYWERYRKDEITQDELRYGRLKDTFDLLDYEINDEMIHLISEDYITQLPDNNHLFDGAIEVLDYLNENYRLHIITNGFHGIQGRKLDNSKIMHYFQTVTNSESAGAKKPNKIIFDHALQVAGAERSKSIMIGDCIEADVRGALDCGLQAILFHEVPCGDATITQISKLLEIKKYL